MTLGVTGFPIAADEEWFYGNYQSVTATRRYRNVLALQASSHQLPGQPQPGMPSPTP